MSGLTPAQQAILETPPVWLPTHLEWLDAKAAVLLQDFERVPMEDTEGLIRSGLAYRAVIRVRDQVAALIEQQQEGRT